MRVGAATNQAVSIVAADPAAFGHDGDAIAAYVEDVAAKLIGVMGRLADALSPQAAAPAPVAAPAPQYPTAVVPRPQVAAAVGQAAAVAAFGATVQDETTFSGNTRPMKLGENPGLPAWLHAQATAVGVTEVWDNRGKPNYVAAIASGNPKTPAPFRSATEGIDKAFWPPKR